VVAACQGWRFGLDIAVINGAIVFLREQFAVDLNRGAAALLSEGAALRWWDPGATGSGKKILILRRSCSRCRRLPRASRG
jgi:hypothetical protein